MGHYSGNMRPGGKNSQHVWAGLQGMTPSLAVSLLRSFSFSERVVFSWVVVTRPVLTPRTVLEVDRAEPLIPVSGDHRTVSSYPSGAACLAFWKPCNLSYCVPGSTHRAFFSRSDGHTNPQSPLNIPWGRALILNFWLVRKAGTLVSREGWGRWVELCSCIPMLSHFQDMSGLCAPIPFCCGDLCCHSTHTLPL